MHQLLRDRHVVVREKNHMIAGVRAADELHPLPDQCLPGRIGRVGLAGYDQLHRAVRIRQQPQQSRGVAQQQVGPFVGGESPRESQGEHLRVEQLPRRVSDFGGLTRHHQHPGQVLARAGNQCRPRLIAESP